MARLLLEWIKESASATSESVQLDRAFTHEEIAQMIGTSRETVTRLFAELKKKQVVQSKGSTLVIKNKAALKAIATS